jgi:hypothetical protein
VEGVEVALEDALAHRAGRTTDTRRRGRGTIGTWGTEGGTTTTLGRRGSDDWRAKADHGGLDCTDLTATGRRGRLDGCDGSLNEMD